MENASKAIIIAGSILIGVIILTIFAIVFTSYSRTSEQVGDQMSAQEVKAFNMQFLKYVEYGSDGKPYITAQNFITIANLAEEINQKEGYNKIQVISNCASYPESNAELIKKFFYDVSGQIRKDKLYKEIITASGKKIVNMYYLITTDFNNKFYYSKDGTIKEITVDLAGACYYYKDEKGQVIKY